jgi:acetyl-CoA carboxylase biotin carboxyl carrier protein
MDFDQIIKLIDTFNESSLTELKIDQNGTQLTLRRTTGPNPVYTQPIMVHPQTATGASIVPGADAVQHTSPAPGGAPAAAPTGPSPAESGASEGPAPGIEVITSPIVGTVYRSPSPDSPPFCHEGDVVEKGKPICILEAMKVMNELEAEFTMEIVGFKVDNGDMVEYGTPLVEVRRV